MTTAAATSMETEISDALALQQMESGFTGVALSPEVDKAGEKVAMETEALEVETPEETAQEEPVKDVEETGDENIEAKVEEPPAPKELDPEEVRKAMELLQAIPDLQSKLDKLRGDAFGKIGGLERLLKTLQETTPLGQEIKVEESDLQELNVEFPETTKALAPALTRVLKKFKGTAVAVPAVDENALLSRATEIADQIASRRVAVALLTQAHEDWAQVVGAENAQTEFRTWVKNQGAEVEKEIFSTWDHRKLSAKLTEFKKVKEDEAKAKLKPKEASKPDARSQRLAEAIQPRGGKVPPASKAKTPEEQFEEGFNNGPGGNLK